MFATGTLVYNIFYVLAVSCLRWIIPEMERRKRRTNPLHPLRLLKTTRIINSILVLDVNSYSDFTSATDHQSESGREQQQSSRFRNLLDFNSRPVGESVAGFGAFAVLKDGSAA